MILLTFHVGDEQYGVDLDAVEGVVRTVDDGGDGAEGARLDLTSRWGRGSGAAAERGAEVRLRTTSGVLRLGVEGLGEVVRVSRSRLQPLPRFFTSSWLRGVVMVEQEMIIVLHAAEMIRAGQDLAGGGGGESMGA